MAETDKSLADAWGIYCVTRGVLLHVEVPRHVAEERMANWGKLCNFQWISDQHEHRLVPLKMDLTDDPK